MKLKERVVVITGGNRGIGAAIAEGMALEGAHVIITGRNEEKLQSEAKRLADKSQGDSPLCDGCTRRKPGG